MSRGKMLVDLALQKTQSSNNCNYQNLSSNNRIIDLSYNNGIFLSSEPLPENWTIVENVEFEVIDEVLDLPSMEAMDSDNVILNTLEPDQNLHMVEELIQCEECFEVPMEKVNQCIIAQDQRPGEISDKSDKSISLVPYSESSSSDTGSPFPEKSKTRKRRSQVNKNNWFGEKNRQRRERGQTYLGRMKKDGKWSYEKPKELRRMKGRCHCRNREGSLMKCAAISDNDRKSIFEQFWKKLTWGEKKMYINDTITILPTKRWRDRKDTDKSRRSQSLVYYLRVSDINIRVCKTMFLNTLCIGRWSVLNWKNCLKNEGKPSQLRYTRNDRVRPFEERKQQLQAFLDSLPVMESHYCQASSSKNYLLPEWPSKQSLYHFYVTDWCKEHNVEPLSRTNFNEALELQNIALFRPKKDECEKCAAYKVGTVAEEEYQLHIARKQEARQEKEKDKREERYILTADLQAVLMAPKSNISTLYYRTKLQVHNLCFYNLINHDGFCFLWNESEGGINAEEFASVWAYFLKEKLLSGIQNESDRANIKIIMYSDGCTYQNRNAVMSNSLLNVAVTHNITIEQKFLEVGHTQMEADSIHSAIERCLHNKVINVLLLNMYIIARLLVESLVHSM